MASQGNSSLNIVEVAKLPDKNIDPKLIKFNNVTISAENFVCVREEGNIAIVDLKSKASPTRLPVPADSAIMNPVSKVVALRSGQIIYLFSVEMSAKMKQATLTSGPIVFWKWIDPKTVAIVTQDAVFHWSLDGAADPEKVFDRSAYNGQVQVLNYHIDTDKKWMMVCGLGVGEDKQLRGALQVYSADAKASQPIIDSPAACFADVLLDNRTANSRLLCFVMKNAEGKYVINIRELGVPGNEAFVKQGLLTIDDGDMPMSMLADPKVGLVYVTTQRGFVSAYEIQAATPIFHQQLSSSAFFTGCAHSTDGVVLIDSQGRILHLSLHPKNAIPYVTGVLKNLELGVDMARRYNLEGAEHIFKARFTQLLQSQQVKPALELAASSPGNVLRNQDTIELLKRMDANLPLQFFQIILNKPGGKLNAIESVELARPLLSKGDTGVEFLKNWIKENKIECSEQLGELCRPVNPTLALSIFLRADAKDKIVGCFLQLGASEADTTKAREHFACIFKYAEKSSYSPKYMELMQQIVRFNADRAKDFALMLLMGGEVPSGTVDVNQITDLFLRMNDVKNSTNILLEYLRPRGDRPEDAMLQTKLLESNLHSMPQVANAIMDSEDYKFTHYDRLKIAQLCERAQLYQRALEHYTEVSDIKRVLAYANAMKPEFIVDYFGTISPELGLECLHDMLKQNLSQNIRIAVEIAKKWTEHFTAEKLITLFEDVKSFNGLYFFLGSFVNFTSNPAVVFKYIEAATRIGPSASKEIERVCRENNHYDPKQVKDFLLEQPTTSKDPRSLIHVCLRFNFVDELITYLYNNQLFAFIEAFVQKKAPQTAPLVFGVLLDLNASESEITKLLDGLRAPPVHEDADWITRLADSFEARTRLRLLRNWLEARVNEGSTESALHAALAKLYVDSNTSNAKHFLETNQYYDTLTVGKFCESRDPTLAVIVYRKGKNDNELIEVTNKNGFFKDQARYLVSRMDLDIWAKVLDTENTHRRAVIDQVVATALNEAQSADEVSVAVKAFMAADLPNELMELLERLMLHSGDSGSRFADNKNLQNLLILTAIKADAKRVMEYLKRLDKYDTEKIASTCLLDEHKLYEEAFYIYKKHNKNVEAAKVLIENIKDMSRAEEYASILDLPAVWTLLARAYLDEMDPIPSMKHFIRAQDASSFREVINTVNVAVQNSTGDATELYNSLIDYLHMARLKTKDTLIDSELLFALAYTRRHSELEDIVQSPTSAKLVDVGDRVFAAGLYEAARIIYTQISNFAKLAMTLIKLELWQEAVDAARKAKATSTWKFVCFACVDAGEFRFAQICGLNVIGVMEHLMDLITHYEKRGHFNELITLLEAGVNLERTHQGIFTQLGVCYAKHREEKMMEHVKLFHNRSNIAQLITACRQNMLWSEAVFLTQQYEQYETAIEFMIDYSSVAWKNDLFKEILGKCTNTEVFYRAIDFYLSEHPLLLSDMLMELEKKLDHSRVVFKVRSAGHLPLIKSYLKHVQFNDITNVNDALHDLYIEEDNFKALRESIQDYKAFDQASLAERLKKHERLEFRRIAVLLYQKNERYERAIELAKKDELWQDAMQSAAASKNAALAESLLRYFVQAELRECFTATLYACYEFIAPDLVLELAWKNGLTDFAMPYMIQTFATFNSRLSNLEKRLDEQAKEKKEENKKREEESVAAQDAAGLGLNMMGGVNPNAPLMITMAPAMGGMGGMPPMGGMNMGMNNMGMNMGGMPPMGGMGGMNF